MLLFVQMLAAQISNNPKFETLTNDVFDIEKGTHQSWDSKGRMWMTTDKGLACFDGHSTRFINPTSDTKKSPLSNQTRVLQKVILNEYLFTYNDRSDISFFNPIDLTFTHFFADTISENRLPYVPVVQARQAPDSIRWLTTWGAGLCKLNMVTGECISYQNDDDEISEGEPPANFMKDFEVMDDGRFFVTFFFESLVAQPYYFDPETGKFSPVDLEPFIEKYDETMRRNILLALTIVNFVHKDKTGIFWIGCYTGLLRLDWKNQTIDRISGKDKDLRLQNLENARSCIEDNQGQLWVTTANQGILLVNTHTLQVNYLRKEFNKIGAISDDRLATLGIDPQENIWIASESGDFNIYAPIAQQFQIHPWSEMNLDFSNRSAQQIPVNQMLVRPNGKILISNANGIIEYDPETKSSYILVHPLLSIRNISSYIGIKHFRVIGDEIVFITIQTSKPSVAARVDLNTGQIKEIGQRELRLQNLLFRHSGENSPIVFFAGRQNSMLFNYDMENDKVDSTFRLPDSLIVSEKFTLELASGKWLVPFEEGFIGLIDPIEQKNTILSHTDQNNYYPDSTVNCALSEDGENIWIGSETALYLYNEVSGKFERYNKKAGLKDQERVNAITRDKNGIYWIFLTNELLRWNQQTGETFRFNQNHGLTPGNFMPSVPQYDTAGNMYVATYNGVLIFDPIKTQLPVNTLQLYLANATVSDLALSWDPSIDTKEFTSDQNFFTFEFHTNETFKLTPTHYFYKLEGRDKEWQDNDFSNRIRLSDLSPGQYTLFVKSINSFGHESNTLALKFVVEKPFWQKAWFIILMVVILATLIWLLMRHREKTLRKRSIELEQIVRDRTADVVKEKKEADRQRIEAEHQKELVEEKQKEIADSIAYARRIQSAILPPDKYVKSKLPESFILYLPKDIVAGDFYFMEETANHVIFAVADCTGHGVPGAMVSVVCHNALTRAVKEFGLVEPDLILNKTRELVLETFEKSENQVNDGMDIALVSIHKNNQELSFAGANNGLFLIRNNELSELKGDKQPIGKFIHAKPFTKHPLTLQKNDILYLFSDGYADQFGGEQGKPGGKKFKYSRLKSLLLNICSNGMESQRHQLENTLIQWRGDIEQIDDVCITGFKIN